MRRRDAYYNQMSQGEDLSSLTNYDERTVKPIEGTTELKPLGGEQSFSSFRPSAQQFSYSEQPQPSQPFTSSATSPSPLFGERAEKPYEASQSYSAKPSDPPMVFALRADPGVYVYEYADRLEYYRHSHINGMLLINTKYKNR